MVLPDLGVSSSSKGFAICFDSTMPYWLESSEGDLLSIVICCHDQHYRLPAKDREYFTELGFRLPPIPVESAVARRLGDATLGLYHRCIKTWSLASDRSEKYLCDVDNHFNKLGYVKVIAR